MRRLRLGDLEAVVGELAPHIGDAWPPPPDVAAHLGVELAPPSTHAVVRVDVDGGLCALKMFRSWARAEPDREWALLTLLDGTGLAPRPVWRSGGDQPAIVTAWIDGDALRADALTPGDMDAIGHAHEVIHAAAAPAGFPVALNAGAATKARVLSWWEELPDFVAELDLSAAVRKRVAEPPYAASADVAAAIDAAPLVPCRGDAHIRNYLRDAAAVRLLDFEDAGLAQPVFELADMIEHFGNRAVRDDMWRALVDVANVSPDALTIARRLHAEFWFALTIRRAARGLAMSPPISPDEQLRHLESVGA